MLKCDPSHCIALYNIHQAQTDVGMELYRFDINVISFYDINVISAQAMFLYDLL